MVVAVDHGAAKLRAHLVELVAEMRHLVGAVLVAGDDLVNRVNDNCHVALFCGAANEFRRELVHRYAAPAQIPDVDAVDVLRRKAERRVNVFEAMQAGRTV